MNIRNNTKLRELYCEYNDLASLDLSNNADLTYLDTSDNPDLKTLDISSCRKLTDLRTDARGVYVWEGFDMSECRNLEELRLSGSGVTSVDLPITSTLTWLDLENNMIDSLDISANPSLRYI